MRFLKKLSGPTEIRAAFNILDEASRAFKTSAFQQLVRCQIEQQILAHPDEFVRSIQKGISLRQWIYAAIANISGDLVESGKYHLYRGILNPVGPGKDLLCLFDAAVDELVRIGNLDADNAEKQKSAIRENIKSVG